MAQTWEQERTADHKYASYHCKSQNCTWCRTRRARRRAAMLRDLIAAAKPSTTFEYWNLKIAPRRSAPEIPKVQDTPYPSVTPKQVYWLHDPKDRGTHRKCPKRWRGV